MSDKDIKEGSKVEAAIHENWKVGQTHTNGNSKKSPSHVLPEKTAHLSDVCTTKK